MQENPNSQEKKETKKVKGSYFEVPGVPVSDFKGESGMKKTQGNLFEVPGVPISDFKEEAGIKSEGKIEETKTSEDTALQERKEPKGSDFKVPGELETGSTEKSWAKPEEKKEEKAAERTEEIRQEAVEAASEKEATEDREREVKDRQAKEKEAKEKEDREAIEKEAKEKEDREAKEKEAREEKRTVYTMEKRLTKSKNDRKLFGVCGGLGEYFGIDPTLVRLAFVLLTLFGGGIGLVLYIVLAIIMPPETNVEMVPNNRK
jgi:phage shock protein PspC (stress-responsive transcriptional regulator)